MKNLSALFLILFLITSYTVRAHSPLTSSSPKNGQVIHQLLDNIVLEYSKPVRLIKVELFDKTGEKVKLAFMLSAKPNNRFEIPLSPIKPAEYIIKWVAMGRDGHKMKGNISFKFELKDEINSSDG